MQLNLPWSSMRHRIDEKCFDYSLITSTVVVDLLVYARREREITVIEILNLIYFWV